MAAPPAMQDALLSVAERYFEKIDVGSADAKTAICEICVEMHYSVGVASKDFFSQLRRKTYTTPTSYLELLNLYNAMLTDQREQVVRKISHYSAGVNKLLETNVVVDRMKKELVELQPVLAQAARDTQKLLSEVASDQANADAVKARVSKEEAQVGEIAKEAQAIAADAQRDLDEAMPAFYSAVDALKSLSKADIQEVKNYKTPPELVVLTCEAVCILMGNKPDWNEAKKMMADLDFINKLQEYDKDNIPEKYIKGIQKYIKKDKCATQRSARAVPACPVLSCALTPRPRPLLRNRAPPLPLAPSHSPHPNARYPLPLRYPTLLPPSASCPTWWARSPRRPSRFACGCARWTRTPASPRRSSRRRRRSRGRRTS